MEKPGLRTANPLFLSNHVGRRPHSFGLPEVAVAWRIFCYFWAVFSKRTLLTKSVVWKGASKPCPSHRQQLKDCRWTMPRRQPKSVPESCFEDASKSNPSQSKNSQRVLGGLTGGFVGRFCGGLLGLAGGFWGGRAPTDFCFRLADFPADFFGEFLL